MDERELELAKVRQELAELRERVGSPPQARREGREFPPSSPNDHPGMLSSLKKAYKSGRTMVAMYFVDAEGVLRLHRYCHQFPTLDFPKTVQLLLDDIEKEVGPPSVTEAMETATVVPQTVELFGPEVKPAED